MEFTIDKETLKTELGLASRILETKPTIPVLANALLTSIDGGSVLMTATNLDITYKAILPVELKKGGSLCLEARKLLEIASKATGERVLTKADKNDWARVESGASRYRLAGAAPDQFPSVELGAHAADEIDRAKLLEAFRATFYAVSNDASRFQMSGVKFDPREKEFSAVGLDGHRLAVSVYPQEKTPSSLVDCLIPKKAVQEFMHLLDGAKESETVSIGADENHIVLKADLRTIIARKIAGEFPNYVMMFPKGNVNEFTVNAREFADAVKRMAIVVEKRMFGMDFVVSENRLEIKAASAEEGEASEVLPIEFTGTGETLKMNYKYLLDALDYLGDDPVRFTFKDAIQQIELFRAGSDDFRYIISLLRF